MSNHTHLCSAHLCSSTFGNNLKLLKPPLFPPAFSSFITPPFSFPPSSPNFFPLSVYVQLGISSLGSRFTSRTYLCDQNTASICHHGYVRPFFSARVLSSSTLRKWKSVWALGSDSLNVLINPLGVISCVKVSFRAKTMDLFLFLEHHRAEINQERWDLPIAAARATRVRSVCPLMPNKSNYNLGREMGGNVAQR